MNLAQRRTPGRVVKSGKWWGLTKKMNSQVQNGNDWVPLYPQQNFPERRRKKKVRMVSSEMATWVGLMVGKILDRWSMR